MNWQNKPILIAGVGLSIVLWIWESFQKSFLAIGEYTFLAFFCVGGVFWLLTASRQKVTPTLSLPATKEAVMAEIGAVKTIVETIEIEDRERDIANLKHQVDSLEGSLDRSSLNIAIIGAKKTGKTTIESLLRGESIEPDLGFQEGTVCLPNSGDDCELITSISRDCDLVLFLCNGDLTDSELGIVRQIKDSYQYQLLIFNKQDLYPTEERDFLAQNLQQRVKEIVAAENIILTAAAPNPVKVIQQQEDGSEAEYMEAQKPQLTDLCHRLQYLVSEEKDKLVLAATWRQTIALKQEAKDICNAIRKERSLPIIDRYQWIAAAAAFANPVAALDLLAAVAINAQMLVDLSNVYQQKLSLDSAKVSTSSIGKLIVKLGIVEITSQTIAGILKSNAVTYIAGGTIQGISAAYLTHVTGLSLIAYFQEREINMADDRAINIDRFAQKLQEVFEQTKRSTFLQNIVKQSLVKLLPETQTSSAV